MSFRNICRSLAVVSVLALLALPSAAQVVATDAYQVHAYHILTTAGVCTQPASVLQTVDVINTGQVGSPIDVPTAKGTVCANFYIFDRNQEMLECCSLPLTANELASRDMCDLLSNPLTGTVAPDGVIKVVADLPGGPCDPTSIQSPVNGGLRAWRLTNDPTTQRIPVEESAFASAPLTAPEQQFLGQACAFVLYLGSGKGQCFQKF